MPNFWSNDYPSPAEFNTLADEYQLGLQKMIVSGYEEFGPQLLRQHKMVITALRAYASPSHIYDIRNQPDGLDQQISADH